MPWKFLKCPCFILLRIYCSTLKCFLLFLQETKNFRTVYSWWYIVHWLNHPLIFIHAKYIAVKNLCSIWIIQKIVHPQPRCPWRVTCHLFSFVLCVIQILSCIWCLMTVSYNFTFGSLSICFFKSYSTIVPPDCSMAWRISLQIPWLG